MIVHEPIFTDVLYPLNLKQKGISPTLLQQWVDRDSWAPPAITDLQDRELRTFLQYAQQHCRYYRSLFESRGIDTHASDIRSELRRIPPLTKQMVRENVAELWSDEFPSREGLTKKATGGSTGRPMEVWGDPQDYRLNGIVIARQRAWIGWRGGTRTLTYLGGMLDAPSRVNRLAKRLLLNDRAINVMDRSNADFDSLLAGLRRSPPTSIVAYFSILCGLARAAEAQGRALDNVRLAIAAGEPLDERARRHAERWLGCRIYFQYGCRELGTFAQECEEQSGYHYAQDMAYCEVTDESGAEVERGHLTITYFGNRVVPLIRYQIGDGATLEDAPCKCGRPYRRLKSIDGRISSMIRTPDNRSITSMIFPHLFKDYVWIQEYQVEQKGLDRLIIRIRRNEAQFSVSSLQDLEAKLRGLIGDDIRFDWDFETAFLDVPSGKHVYFISRLGLPG